MVGACDVIVFTAGVLTGGRVIDAPQVVAFKVASFDAVAYFAGRDAVRSLLRDDVAFLSRCDTSSESFVLGADGALLGYGCLATAPEEDSTNLASFSGRWRAGSSVGPLGPLVFALPGQ